MSERFDAIVIGASLGGVAAAATLSRRGARVLLLEQGLALREPTGPFTALDPQMLEALGLVMRGLRFSQRDLKLTLLRAGEPPLTLERDVHASVRALRALSDSDAKAWPGLRHALFAQARRLRRWWWSGLTLGSPDWVLESRAAQDAFARLRLTGADAWLGAQLESEALIASLLFDAVAGGLAPSEPGSALALAWHAAQEMAGLQGAAALVVPGSLAAALNGALAAGGTQQRFGARVTRITVQAGQATGVGLEDGEAIAARVVLSSLSRPDTEALLGVARTPVSPVGEARLVIALRDPISLTPARYRIAERAETFATAHEESRAGRLPVQVPMEFVPMDSRTIAVTLRPVPRVLPSKARLAAQAVFALSRHVAHVADNIAGVEIMPPVAMARASLARLAAPPGSHVLMPERRLFLCGADAEPLPSLSGRAARIAAAAALVALKTD